MKKFLRVFFWIVFWIVFTGLFVYGAWWLWDKMQKEEKKVPTTPNITIVTVLNSTETVVTVVPGTINIVPQQTTPINVSSNASANTSIYASLNRTANPIIAGFANQTVVPTFPTPVLVLVPDPSNNKGGIKTYENPKVALWGDLIDFGWGVVNTNNVSLSVDIQFIVNDNIVYILKNINLGAGEVYKYHETFSVGNVTRAMLRIVIVPK